MTDDIATSAWTPVDLSGADIHGVLWGWDRAWAFGHQQLDGEQAPYVAHVLDDGQVTVYDVPARGQLTSACRLEMQLGLSIGESAPRVLYVNDDEPEGAYPETEDSLDNAVRLWLTMGDEDPFYVAEWTGGRLTAGEWLGEDYPEGPELRHEGAPGELLVGSSDGQPFVAGLLSNDGGAGAVGLWSSGPDMGTWGPGGWQQRALDPAPDGFTQIHSSIFPKFAGHLGGQPVLYDHELHLLDVPEVPLDPEHPQVLVPRGPVEIALQSLAEGPQLWRRDAGRWSPRPLPPGRLDAAAVCTTSELVWVVLDGRLWRPIG